MTTWDGIQVVPAIEVAVAFAAICAIGLFARRWRPSGGNALDEWGLGGRAFGGVVTWFLQGGSVYTTYAFIAVPALVFGAGALGFYALPFLTIAYVVAFVFMPKLWILFSARGYVTVSDFVRERFGNRVLAAAITLTGLIALIPYIALQVYGMELCFAQIGLPVEASLWIAFGLLAVITYVAGLRSAALIAIFKDLLIWATVVVAIIYIPMRLGGYSHVVSGLPSHDLVLPAGQWVAYATLALGSGLALFLYPHTVTGAMSARNRFVIQRNCIFLPVYTILLGLLGTMGYFALADHVRPDRTFGANAAVPALFDGIFPPWLAGLALAAIAIGALVPAATMSIAAGNLFSRNVYRELRPRASSREQAQVSKLVSLAAKFGAVAFVVAVPTTFVINFQLAATVWIVQTLPAVFLALVWRRLRAVSVLAGWIVGTALGTYWLLRVDFTTTLHTFSAGVGSVRVFVGIPALAANLAAAAAVQIIVTARPARRFRPTGQRA